MKPLKLHSEPLQPAWLDAYGHLNEAYYLVPFSNASWALQEHFDIGVAYFERTGGALYTVESHIRYLQEVRAPAQIEIESLVLECDAKRLRFVHVMIVDGTERATIECVTLHFDSRAGRTAPFPEPARRALAEACAAEWPDWAGASISLGPRG
jgi:acyl-CoA thioesterase FadM